MGITNEIFPNEREEDPKCATNQLAENHTGFDTAHATQTLFQPADIVAFMGFMRFLDQPAPACVLGKDCSTSIENGSALFQKIGCAVCLQPPSTTELSGIDAFNQKLTTLL